MGEGREERQLLLFSSTPCEESSWKHSLGQDKRKDAHTGTHLCVARAPTEEDTEEKPKAAWAIWARLPGGGDGPVGT